MSREISILDIDSEAQQGEPWAGSTSCHCCHWLLFRFAMAPLAMALIMTIRDVVFFALQRVCMDASIGIDVDFDRGQSLKLTVCRGNWLHLNGRFVSFSSLRVQFDCMSSRFMV